MLFPYLNDFADKKGKSIAGTYFGTYFARRA